MNFSKYDWRWYWMIRLDRNNFRHRKDLRYNKVHKILHGERFEKKSKWTRNYPREPRYYL